ncbi:hypothetical protein FGK63_02990 [Ruegeria sediminis]|uniref:Uncharacterized protein n=1 Tax=Ruegeria sediminis TaxID=2583820 RepID=A0ABY2X3S7_9RHOB|nr:hypothetical protein [Ruegeria sediminis]TMV10041.1 hypothetical protein FGK63_02990 [Ruegeria sediminis]
MADAPRIPDFGSRLALGGRAASAWFLAVVVTALLGFLAFVYGRPVSHSAVFVEDSFVFFDGIHRVAHGKTPHVDFSTPVGALAYWLPYLGHVLAGGYAGAIEFASLLLAAVVVPIGAVLIWRRAAPAMALAVLATIAGIIVVPLVPGWVPEEVSHAMHYNRWSWGVILALFLLGLPPAPDDPPGWLRGSLAALLLSALFLTKITYFAVGSVYLILLLAYPDTRRRDAVVAFAGTALMLGICVVATGGMVFSYLADLAQALEVDEAVRGSYLSVAMISRNSLILLVLAAYAAVLKGNLRWQDLLVAGYVGASGLAIIDQNFQYTFIVSLPAAFALLAAPQGTASDAIRIGNSVIIAACFAMLLPYAADWARVTLRHMQPAPAGSFTTLDLPGFRGIHVYDRNKQEPSETSTRSGPVDAKAYLRGETKITWLNQRDNLPAFEDGVRLLQSAGVKDATIFTLDYSNVMPVLVDAPREPYGYSWYHFGRNVSEETLPDGPEMFEGVDYVMAPLKSYSLVADYFRDIYGDYLAGTLTEVAQSDSWILFRHAPERD